MADGKGKPEIRNQKPEGKPAEANQKVGSQKSEGIGRVQVSRQIPNGSEVRDSLSESLTRSRGEIEKKPNVLLRVLRVSA
jgi:hypothetical protein